MKLEGNIPIFLPPPKKMNYTIGSLTNLLFSLSVTKHRNNNPTFPYN